MTRPHTPYGDRDRSARTRRLPAATQRIPMPPTQQMPAPTELMPESRPDGPTRAIRQVRARTEDGDWPAIPMLPVIRPDDGEAPSEADRARVERMQEQGVPPWPQREEPDENFRI